MTSEDERDDTTSSGRTRKDEREKLLYSVNDVPPWHLTALLGLQNFLTAQSSLFSTPFLLSQAFCMDQDSGGLVDLIGTMMFVSGLSTFLQTTFGVRLPIVQGATASLIVPTLAILSQKEWECPYTQARLKYGPTVNFTALDLPEVGSEDHKTIWKLRIREIQGAIMVASLVQVTVGFSGAVGLILRFVGPLAITPTLTLIGLALFPIAADMASQHWWIAIMTMFFVVLCCQYLKNVNVPCCSCGIKDGTKKTHMSLFKLFPVLLGMIIAWAICAILTVADVLPRDKGEWGYEARTDRRYDILISSKWFRVPYPGQWGTPTITIGSTLGMVAGIFASMIESVGDYYACARLSGAPPPPGHAVNRGIGMEGLCSILAGAWGTGNGTTSYSENIGTIGITKVGSRRVVQAGGLLMILLGCFGKIGAVFASIPTPIVGGMLIVTSSMVVAVGLSNLQYVHMNSTRNVFIVGLSIFFGLSLPMWLSQRNTVINTGNDIVNQILGVLLSTSMFVGGLMGIILDNTIPGTVEERGIRKWRELTTDQLDDVSHHSYDLPLVQGLLDKVSVFRFLPFCPSFLLRRNSYPQIYTNSSVNKYETTQRNVISTDLEDVVKIV